MPALPEPGVSAPNAPAAPAPQQGYPGAQAYPGAQGHPAQQAAQAPLQQPAPQQPMPQPAMPQPAMPQQPMPQQAAYGQPPQAAYPQAQSPAGQVQAGYPQPNQAGAAYGAAGYGAAAAAAGAAALGGAQQGYAQQGYAQQGYAQQGYAQQQASNLPRAQIGPLPTFPVQHEAEPKHTPIQLNEDLPVDHMLAKVSQLFAQDKSAEARQKKLMTWGMICFFVGVFTAWLIIGIPILLIGIGLFIYRAVGSSSKQDVEDRKLEVIAGVLSGLRGEIRANRPVHVGADFGAYPNVQPSQYTEAGTGMFESKTTAASYQHWWLNMRFALVDGTGVTLDVIQQAKRKTAQKRKYTKMKDRVIERINVKINAPGGKSFGPSVMNRQWKSERFNGLLLKRVIVRPRYAVFQYQAAATTRVRGRGGWFAQNLEQGEITSPKALAAIVNSYKSVASVQNAS